MTSGRGSIKRKGKGEGESGVTSPCSPVTRKIRMGRGGGMDGLGGRKMWGLEENTGGDEGLSGGDNFIGELLVGGKLDGDFTKGEGF